MSTIHELDNDDDNKLLEKVKNIIGYMPIMPDKNNLGYSVKEKHYIYCRLKAKNNQRVKQRINGIIKKIKQQVLLHNNQIEATSATKPNKNEIITKHFMNDLLKNKTKEQLLIECKNEDCKAMPTKDIFDKCESIKRIAMLFNLYNQDINIFLNDVISCKHIYGHQQLLDDFLHIKLFHIQIAKNRYPEILYQQFQKKYECTHRLQCTARLRHYKSKQLVDDIKTNDNKDNTNKNAYEDMMDMMFQQAFDKIHCFFLHSSQLDQELIVNPAIPFEHLQKMKMKQDELWFQQFDVMNEEDGYKNLKGKMGHYLYQAPYGFRGRENRGLPILKPKFKNIKQEVLYNEYCPFAGSWQQKLRKAKIYFSFLKRRLTTSNDGSFYDRMTNTRKTWKHSEGMTLAEIMAMKLFLDTPSLACEFRKCFRLDSTQTENEKKTLSLLQQRLSQFYHLRLMLLIAITKFGEPIGYKVLYHGINDTMMLSLPETFAFYGPLSTSSSFHATKHFAKHDKGMILKITSQFPKLNAGRMFDASVVSDYPEEQEWLVGFMYLRILCVKAKYAMSIPSFCKELF
eukprot:482665_1